MKKLIVVFIVITLVLTPMIAWSAEDYNDAAEPTVQEEVTVDVVEVGINDESGIKEKDKGVVEAPKEEQVVDESAQDKNVGGATGSETGRSPSRATVVFIISGAIIIALGAIFVIKRRK